MEIVNGYHVKKPEIYSKVTHKHIREKGKKWFKNIIMNAKTFTMHKLREIDDYFILRFSFASIARFRQYM